MTHRQHPAVSWWQHALRARGRGRVWRHAHGVVGAQPDATWRGLMQPDATSRHLTQPHDAAACNLMTGHAAQAMLDHGSNVALVCSGSLGDAHLVALVREEMKVLLSCCSKLF